jgi:hypothetical protein
VAIYREQVILFVVGVSNSTLTEISNALKIVKFVLILQTPVAVFFRSPLVKVLQRDVVAV